MDHADHVGLLRAGLDGVGAGEVWADVGAGTGAFTLALADLLGAGSTIVAIDRDGDALAANGAAIEARFPAVHHRALVADMTGPLEVPLLDGLIAANSLHFVPRARQLETVRRLASLVRPAGRFIVVEYDADHGNRWVPDPFTFDSWRTLAAAAGLRDTRLIGRLPSRFLGAIYAASSRTQAGRPAV